MAESDLLRLLEPAVRPATGGVSGRSGRAPFESRSFEQLLAEASQSETEGGSEPGASAGTKRDPTSRLAEMGSIENAGVRALLSGRASL